MISGDECILFPSIILIEIKEVAYGYLFFVHFSLIKGAEKMETLAVKLINIEKNFGAKNILSIDELTIYQNERIAIIGKNGSGKSTLLKMIAGKVEPDRGKVQREIAGYYPWQAGILRWSFPVFWFHPVNPCPAVLSYRFSIKKRPRFI